LHISYSQVANMSNNCKYGSFPPIGNIGKVYFHDIMKNDAYCPHLLVQESPTIIILVVEYVTFQ